MVQVYSSRRQQRNCTTVLWIQTQWAERQDLKQIWHSSDGAQSSRRIISIFMGNGIRKGKADFDVSWGKPASPLISLVWHLRGNTTGFMHVSSGRQNRPHPGEDFVSVVFQLRALCLPGRGSTTRVMLLVLFCFIFHVVLFLPRLTLDLNPPTYASWVAGIIDACHHAQLVCWDVVLLTCLGWPWTMIFPLTAPGVARITDVSHHAQLREDFQGDVFLNY
jgi:hypothetical protein